MTAASTTPPVQNKQWVARMIIILVVIASAALAFGLVIWKRQNQEDLTGSPVGQARADIMFLQSQLRSYLRVTGRYPTEQEGLEALVKVKVLSAVPNDPWNRPYVYRVEHDVGRVISLGRDGLEGGTGEDADVDSSFTKAKSGSGP